MAAGFRSPSALLIRMMSAISMMPRLTPCNSSPPAGASSSRKMSHISATMVSDWPTPTVSTRITSNPAASHRAMASRVRRATPPSVVCEGDGRIKALGSRESRSIRVLSPRIEPPERAELGSTASTATLSPRSSSIMPKVSVKVDLPTPGVPDRPMRRASRSVLARRASSRATACSRWSGRVLSTSVIARASARRLPSMISWASCVMSSKRWPPLWLTMLLPRGCGVVQWVASVKSGRSYLEYADWCFSAGVPGGTPVSARPAPQETGIPLARGQCYHGPTPPPAGAVP